MRGRAGQVTEISVFATDRDLGNRDENFPTWTLQPGDRDETFSTK